MRIKGKITSFALVTAMILSCAPTTVFAAEDNPVEISAEMEDTTEQEVGEATPTNPEKDANETATEEEITPVGESIPVEENAPNEESVIVPKEEALVMEDNAPAKYTVEFDGNGAISGTMKHMVCSYDESYFLRELKFKRKGYNFSSWNTMPDGSGTSYTNQESIVNLCSKQGAVVTLYAQWEPIVYNIVFKPYRAESGTMQNQSYKYDETYRLPSNTYQKTGYTFTGWNTKPDGSGRAFGNQVSVKNLTAIDGNTINLYPQWTKTNYSIVYNMDGGTNNSKNPSGYNITSNTITLKDASKPGYIFKGWYSDSKYKNKVTEIPKGSTGKKTLYAKWELRTYNIKYEYVGNLYGMAHQTYTIETDTFKLPTPSRTGYKFCGWYKNKDYSGTPIYEIKKGSYKGLHLYAKMEPITYKVVFLGNGATSGRVAPMTCTYDRSYSLPYKNVFSREGYAFDGWSESPLPGAIHMGYSFKNLTARDGETVYIYARWRTTIRFIEPLKHPINCKSYNKEGVAYSELKYTFSTYSFNQKADGSYTLTLLLQGRKIYENSPNRPIASHYELYNKAGFKVAEDDFIIKDVVLDEAFSEYLSINHLPLDEYRIVFSDYHEK